MAASLKLGVRAVYLTSANVLFISFLAFNEINKLRVISEAQNSDSPRLHHLLPATPQASSMPDIAYNRADGSNFIGCSLSSHGQPSLG